MRTFYETKCPVLNRQITSTDLDEEFFLSVGFMHHREMISKNQDEDIEELKISSIFFGKLKPNVVP